MLRTTLLLSLLTAGGVEAQLPPAVTAVRAILTDPADDDKILYWKAGNSVALQGSIAKLMTAYVTFWAARQGQVKLSDVVELTPRDVKQGCTCMKFSGSGANCSLTSSTVAGDKFLLRDLLEVTLNQSAGESCD